MALKQMTIRYDDAEIELLKRLAEHDGLNIANAVRQSIKEACEKRNIEVPEGAFGRKQEGRPKETALIVINPSAA